ncbi:TPA: ead/Ea22-like family protein [Salmonella enterica subsp. enterica serovar Orion]
MSNIDKQALREVAERATQGKWSLEYGEGVFDGNDALIHREATGYIPVCRIEGAHPESGFDEDFQMEQQANAEFIAAANPATMLALLDENIQLQREKDAIEAVALALRDDMRDAREKLEAAERRIAELEARKAKPVMFIDGDISPADADKLAAVIRGFNEEIETPAARMARIIRENPHPTNMCDMAATGIDVKQQQDSVDSDAGSRNQPGMVVAVHIDAGDFVKVKGQVFEVEETDFDDHDVTLWFVGGDALKCSAGCPVEVVSGPVADDIKFKGE